MLRLKRSNFERPASNGPSLSPGTCLIRSLRSGRFLFSPYGLSPQEVPADCLQEILPFAFFGARRELTNGPQDCLGRSLLGLAVGHPSTTYPTHDLAKGPYSDLRGSPEFPNAGGKQPHVKGQSPTCLGRVVRLVKNDGMTDR